MPKRADGQPAQKRKMSLRGRINVQYGDRQITWDELWINTAFLTAMRARCSRDRVGAAIVDAENRLLAVGYNGAPSGFPSTGMCINWCPRAIAAAGGEPVAGGYDDCYALHAEANAILRASQRPFSAGTTIYVSSSTCYSCAKLICGSGITRVVMDIQPEHRYRNPDEVIAFLTESGVEVVIWAAGAGSYRAVFETTYGIGPHACYFCGSIMPKVEMIHHLDHDHFNNAPENLVAAHLACHTSYHSDASANTAKATGKLASNPKAFNPWHRRQSMIKCDTCEVVSTPGWMRRHCTRLEHASSELVAHDEAQLQRAGTLPYQCNYCERRFKTAQGRNGHEARWCTLAKVGGTHEP